MHGDLAVITAGSETDVIFHQSIVIINRNGLNCCAWMLIGHDLFGLLLRQRGCACAAVVEQLAVK